MNIIAEGTKNVETLYISDGKISSGAFDKFIDKNKSRLKSVGVFHASLGIHTSEASKMVGKFLE